MTVPAFILLLIIFPKKNWVKISQSELRGANKTDHSRQSFRNYSFPITTAIRSSLHPMLSSDSAHSQAVVCLLNKHDAKENLQQETSPTNNYCPWSRERWPAWQQWLISPPATCHLRLHLLYAALILGSTTFHLPNMLEPGLLTIKGLR